MTIDLIIDANNLASRMFFVMPGLSVEGNGEQRGAIHGFLSQIRKLREQFKADRVLFCFDSDRYVRKELFPGYKAMSPQAGIGTKDKKYLRPQIKKLREEILLKIGFNNVFCQDGYEADDLIAACCNSFQVKDAVIVSSDKDLYQCLRDAPGKKIVQHVFASKPVTVDFVKEEYGVTVDRWPEVKAMSGCVSDNIPGVPGVKEKTACKYINGEINSLTQVGRKIRTSKERIEQNLKLVTLPLEGCEIPHIHEDGDTPGQWDRVARSLGLQLR